LLAEFLGGYSHKKRLQLGSRGRRVPANARKSTVSIESPGLALSFRGDPKQTYVCPMTVASSCKTRVMESSIQLG